MNRSTYLVVCLSLLLGCSGASDSKKAANKKPKSPVAKKKVKQKAPADPTRAGLPSPLSQSELRQGWIALFDGQTLYGWKKGKEANWRVEAGTIVVDSGDVGLLVTTTQFADYELQLEFRSDKGTNSGVFLHTPPIPTDPAKDCYELNIADQDNPFPTGSLVKRKKVTGPNDKTDWQSLNIVVQGPQVIAKLDGQEVLSYSDEQQTALRRGHIGLQHNTGRVAFRNIKLRPLGSTPIFNGKDLSGWKEYPKMLTKFTVTNEGWLNGKGGKGQLETTGSYGDFILQLECISNVADVNSGVFFRCIPGDTMMGYESQINNTFDENDRKQPHDYGTGGIFRRVKARFVMGDDKKWVHKTLIADGLHFAAWVNGIQVSDVVDERKPDVNPRRGSRTEPGTIIIQGHDATTDISFRALKIVELPQRTAAK